MSGMVWLGEPQIAAEPGGFSITQDVQVGSVRAWECLVVETWDDDSVRMYTRGEDVRIPAHWLVILVERLQQMAEVAA